MNYTVQSYQNTDSASIRPNSVHILTQTIHRTHSSYIGNYAIRNKKQIKAVGI